MLLFKETVDVLWAGSASWSVLEIIAESAEVVDVEGGAELDGVIVCASHVLLEESIFASVDEAVVVDVHLFEEAIDVGRAGLVVFQVRNDGLDAVEGTGWDLHVALDVCIERVELLVEEDATNWDCNEYGEGVECGDHVRIPNVVCGSGAICGLLRGILFLRGLVGSIVVVLVKVANERVRGVGQRVASEYDAKGLDHEQDGGLHGVPPADGGVETNWVSSGLGNSEGNLLPDVACEHDRQDDDDKSPQVPRQDYKHLVQVQIVREIRVISIGKVITICEANPWVNGLDDDECSGSEAHAHRNEVHSVDPILGTQFAGVETIEDFPSEEVLGQAEQAREIQERTEAS